MFEEQGISKPVNLYVMFDKSASMAGNKWESAKAGLGALRPAGGKHLSC